MNERPEPKFLPCGEGCSAENVAAMAADGWKRCTHSITHRTESDHKLCAHGPMCLWCKPTGPESDFKLGSCEHEWSGRDGRCVVCGLRQSDEGTGIDRALNPIPESPVVTRNAMSPDGLWAMQEKPHVSDDAPDMGPIPGTEGIESDPPEDAPWLHLRCNDRIKAAEQRAEIAEQAWAEVSHRESPLPDPCSPAELWASMIEELEAERDALKADLADALNYRRFYRDEHKANEALRAMLSHLLKSGRLGGIDAEKVSQLLEGE